MCDGQLPDLYLFQRVLAGCRVSESGSWMDEASRSFGCKRKVSLLDYLREATGWIEVKYKFFEEKREMRMLQFSTIG